MEKWSGSIGFATDVDNGFGIHSEKIVEYPYQGNLLRVYQTNTNSTSVNADVNLSLKINIVASAYLNRNISKIQYNIDIYYKRERMPSGHPFSSLICNYRELDSH